MFVTKVRCRERYHPAPFGPATLPPSCTNTDYNQIDACDPPTHPPSFLVLRVFLIRILSFVRIGFSGINRETFLSPPSLFSALVSVWNILFEIKSCDFELNILLFNYFPRIDFDFRRVRTFFFLFEFKLTFRIEIIITFPSPVEFHRNYPFRSLINYLRFLVDFSRALRPASSTANIICHFSSFLPNTSHIIRYTP